MQPESDFPTHQVKAPPARMLPVWIGLLVALVGVAYGVREGGRARVLEQNQQAMTATVEQLQKQTQELSDRMAAWIAAEQQAAAQRQAAQAQARRTPAPRTAPAAAGRAPAEDPRWKKVEAQLSDQDAKISSTQEQLAQARAALEGNLDSAKSELSGSIARTHEELVALQKRGERDYQEFELFKSKEFRRVGPFSLALRKADTKRKRYDLELIVDDVKLQKKSVNLFEPVYFSVSDRPQPVELVVNQISKDRVTGYLSLPKYKKAELASAPPRLP